MNGNCLIPAVLCILVLFSRQAYAIAVADLATAQDPPSDEGYSFDWSHVHKYKNSSSAAVDHYWILTAGHVANDGGSGSLSIGGETYLQQEIVHHPSADLALVRYDKPFPGYYSLSTSIPIGDEVLFCGYGRSGSVYQSSTSGYFTDSLSGNGIKRWGSNRIDNDIPYAYDTGDALGWTTNLGFEVTISGTKPSEGKTEFESGGNVYDSGAGLFHENGDSWELVGTMTTRTNNGFNYTGNFAVGTKYYVDWIKSVIVDYDTDMDGLPDWWEDEHGASETAMDANGHSDSDGFTNYDEWLADTDPNDGDSFLALGEYTNASSVVFNSSTNRKYQVQYRTNLTNTLWGTEVDWFDAASTQTVKSVSTFTSNRFYRIRAKLR